jgi:hypothetical protein
MWCKRAPDRFPGDLWCRSNHHHMRKQSATPFAVGFWRCPRCVVRSSRAPAPSSPPLPLRLRPRPRPRCGTERKPGAAVRFVCTGAARPARIHARSREKLCFDASSPNTSVSSAVVSGRSYSRNSDSHEPQPRTAASWLKLPASYGVVARGTVGLFR